MPPANEVCAEHINVVLDPTHIGVEEVADHSATVGVSQYLSIGEFPYPILIAMKWVGAVGIGEIEGPCACGNLTVRWREA